MCVLGIDRSRGGVRRSSWAIASWLTLSSVSHSLAHASPTSCGVCMSVVAVLCVHVQTASDVSTSATARLRTLHHNTTTSPQPPQPTQGNGAAGEAPPALLHPRHRVACRAGCVPRACPPIAHRPSPLHTLTPTNTCTHILYIYTQGRSAARATGGRGTCCCLHHRRRKGEMEMGRREGWGWGCRPQRR